MGLLRRLLWLLIAGIVLAGAVVLSGRFQAADRLLSVFLAVSPSLPAWMSFEQFLAAAVMACLLVAVLTIFVAMGALGLTQVQIRRAQRKEGERETALRQEIDHLRTEVQHEYERLIGLSATLTQHLDKRALIQNVLQATTQITSLPQVDSAVALWVFDFETDQMRFEMGLRCDAALFTKTQLALTEPPLPRLAAGRQALRFAKWDEGFPYVAKEKTASLGVANSLLIIPLIIERNVLGFLVVFCHRDVVKQYEKQQAFFNAAWGQLALALSIAIQGELAILDRLTGVANRAYFLKRLAQEVERSNRYEMPVGLLMIDIDNFKVINDTLGHQQGDAVLKMVAKLIKREVRVIDLVGRYGGEEFIVMLPETGFTEVSKASSGAQLVAERIRKAVEEEFRSLQKPLAVTISVGVAVRRYPQDRHMGVEELIRLADEQLYRAKRSGKNQCCVYLPGETEPVSSKAPTEAS